MATKTDNDSIARLVENKDLSQRDLIRQLKLSCALLKKENDAYKMQGRFIAMASHEFRSPLTSIHLSASLMELYYNKMDYQKKMFHLNKIKTAVNDLTALLDDFLSVERLTSGASVPVLTAFDLEAFCADIVSEMHWATKEHQQIRYNRKGKRETVLSDKGFLKHCIVNLLSNALKYSGEGGIVEFETELSDKQYIIRVADKGIGIPKKNQRHIFEAFYRAANTGDISGTGLGLNIVAHYVGLLNGKIGFESELKRGTVFTMTFPVEREGF